MAGKKEYTLIINGVEKNIKDVTTLNDLLKNLDTTVKGVSGSAGAALSVSKGRAKALTEEEKAAKKLADTERKIQAVRDGATDAQIRANQELREATREQSRKIQADQLAEDSIKRMGMQLTDLRNEYESLSKAQRDDVTVGGELLQRIQELDAEYKSLRESTGNFRDSVGNYEKALNGLGKLSDGVDGITKSTMGLAQTLLLSNTLMGLFGKENEESAEQAERLNKILALLSIAEQVNTNLIRESIVQNKLAAVTDSIRAVQLKAKTAAEVASTKGTIAATVAQKAFNLVASANPYVILSLGLAAVTTGLYAFVSGNTKARKEQSKLNGELSTTVRLLNQLDRDMELAAAIAEAEGKSEEEIILIRRRSARERREQAERLYDDIIKNGNATKEQISEAEKLMNEAYERERALNDQATVLEVKNRKERADKAKEAIKTELDELRAAEDARLDLMQDSVKKIEVTYDRQIEDLRKRLSTETDLTKKAREAINDQIVSLEKQKNKELQDLQDEQTAKTLELERQVEDSRIALIQDETERRRTEINLQYDREVEDLKKRLEKEKDLTEEQQKAINELILNAQDARANELLKLTSDELAVRADLELSAIDDMYAQIEKKQKIVRDKDDIGLIDVDATKNNLREINSSLDEYIKHLTAYQASLTESHKISLTGLQKGSVEYEREVQSYARAMENVSDRIKTALKSQSDNTKQATEVQADYYKELLEKIGKYAEEVSQAVSAVTDTLNANLQLQLDGLNEQLDIISEKYEQTQEQREKAAQKVEELEERLRNATGSTAAALREQLNDEVRAREKAAREEEKLAKEKEKREAEIAEKEKKMRRNDLISNIARGIADTASAVIGALGNKPWGIWNIALASLVGTMGAAQVGIMSEQLSKLEKGGEINGPSHANGGVPILISGVPTYEAQGGEFMINDKSYRANKSLVNFINDNPRPLLFSDLIGVLPGNTVPSVVSDAPLSQEYRIIDAIENMEIKPVVSVTDIIDATDEVVTVRDLAGF
ncbi:coiled-coil domain-containing protein [Bacteroides nordii]|uniref:Uncharacterized protein n=1 Tax=Bacteroides nordii CL02T12C05 TaxID=997884 RepID=I9RXJ6_9BACE|nr:hypothetical protein [Bacteroides nordii]EIY47548.1 hypothetical protein HMPREF1068_03198 [Bacteroides nordii CL02T12C05]